MEQIAKIILLVLSSLSLDASATTILVLHSPEVIFIAADSQISHLDGSEARFGCKLHIAQKIAWGSAGLLMETLGPFNINSFAEDAIKRGGSLPEIVSRFDERMTNELPLVARRMRNFDPAQYSSWITNHAHIDVFFSTATNGMAMTEFRSFAISQIGTEIKIGILSKDCPGQGCVNGTELGELGQRSAIDRELETRHAIWREIGIIPALKYLITKQADETPQFVSGAIAVLEIRRTGVIEWVEHGSCN